MRYHFHDNAHVYGITETRLAKQVRVGGGMNGPVGKLSITALIVTHFGLLSCGGSCKQ